MDEKDNFFSSNHNQMLNIATWAKYLAWVVLIVYIVLAVLQFFQYQAMFSTSSQFQTSILSFFKNNPFDAFRVLVNMATSVLRGIIFYIALKGISLGLNMIVETDINYREQKGGLA